MMGTLTAKDGTIVNVNILSDEYVFEQGPRTKVTPLYDRKAIYHLAGEIRGVIRDQFDCCIMITGKRRTGKSTLAIQLAKAVSDDFSIDDIVFKINDFSQRISEHPYADPRNNVYPQIILDEAGFDLFAQEWQEKIQKAIVKKLEVIGKKNLIIYFVLPHRKKLNKSIREEMIAYWIHTRVVAGQRGVAEVRIPTDNIWEENLFWRPMYAFVFPELQGEFWDTYEKKKMSFLNEVASDDYVGPTHVMADDVTGFSLPKFLEDGNIVIKGKLAKRWKDQRDTLLRFLHRKRKVLSMTEQEIADLVGIERCSLNKIVNATFEETVSKETL